MRTHTTNMEIIKIRRMHAQGASLAVIQEAVQLHEDSINRVIDNTPSVEDDGDEVEVETMPKQTAAQKKAAAKAAAKAALT